MTIKAKAEAPKPAQASMRARFLRRALAIASAGALLAAFGPALGPFGHGSPARVAWTSVAAASPAGPSFRSHFFSDTSESQAEYLDMVGTLGLISGERGLGGRVWPLGPVTRLEVAVAIHRLLALDPSFEAPPAVALPFTDKAAIPDWALPSVSACYGLGVIGGLPDGAGGLRFSPDESVMGIDVVVMLLRALGDATDVTGGFPVGYLYRAYEVGLLSTDVVPGDWRFVEPLTPVDRARFAYLLSQATSARRDFSPGAPGRPGTFGAGALASRLTGYALVLDVDEARGTFRTSDGKAFTLASTVVAGDLPGPEDLIGRRIFWLKNSRGQVAFVRAYPRGTAQAGRLEKLEISPQGTVAAVVLQGGQRIPCLDGIVVDVNGLRWPFDPAILRPSVEVTALIEGDRAVRVYLFQEDWPEGVIRGLEFGPLITSPDGSQVPTGAVLASLGMGDAILRLEVDSETRITLNTKPADLTDLREGDVFSAYTSGTLPKRLLRLDAIRDRANGVLRRLIPRRGATDVRWRMQVDTSPGWTDTFSLSPFADVKAATALPGVTYSFYSNASGQVAYFAPALPPEEPAVVKTLGFHAVGGKRLLTVDWLGREITTALPPTIAPLPDGILARLTVDMSGDTVSLGAAFPPKIDATLVDVDYATRNATFSRGTTTWVLDLSNIPIYAIPSPFEVGSVGEAVPAWHLRPGSPVWLDRQYDPGYVLVFMREGS